jgi:glutamyl-tRNA synthetase
MSVRTRFAPSPTGVLHLGSVRTALFCWLHARHFGGTFILRIEDTDRQRSTPENVQAILDGLDWLGMDADEGPFFQTQRFSRYNEVIEEWLDTGKAYRCYCSRERLAELREKQMAAGEKTRYDGRCRSVSNDSPGVAPVIRFRNPDHGEVVVQDLVRGRVVFNNVELDDLIILRSDGTPTYNFCVIVDDHDMAVTHVIRGDDHLNNTPRQMNMLAAMGVDPPKYAHLPMILGPDGAKLSKRHGAVDIRDYRELGYLPEAMLNYLARLGWSHGDQEIFSTEELVSLFDIADVNQSASAFNPEKLRWLNQQHIKAMSVQSLGERLESFLVRCGYELSNGPSPVEVAAAFRERAETLEELAEMCWYCYRDLEAVQPDAAKKHLRPIVLDAMVDVLARFEAISEWNSQTVGEAIEAAAANNQINMGKIGQPLRVAVTGGPVSPPIDVTLALVGRDKTLQRIADAIAFIQARAAANP